MMLLMLTVTTAGLERGGSGESARGETRPRL